MSGQEGKKMVTAFSIKSESDRGIKFIYFFFFQIKFKEAGIYQTHHRQLRDADGGLVNSLFLFPLYYK
jgi:hypothetical protein